MLSQPERDRDTIDCITNQSEGTFFRDGGGRSGFCSDPVPVSSLTIGFTTTSHEHSLLDALQKDRYRLIFKDGKVHERRSHTLSQVPNIGLVDDTRALPLFAGARRA